MSNEKMSKEIDNLSNNIENLLDYLVEQDTKRESNSGTIITLSDGSFKEQETLIKSLILESKRTNDILTSTNTNTLSGYNVNEEDNDVVTFEQPDIISKLNDIKASIDNILLNPEINISPQIKTKIENDLKDIDISIGIKPQFDLDDAETVTNISNNINTLLQTPELLDNLNSDIGLEINPKLNIDKGTISEHLERLSYDLSLLSENITPLDIKTNINVDGMTTQIGNIVDNVDNLDQQIDIDKFEIVKNNLTAIKTDLDELNESSVEITIDSEQIVKLKSDLVSLEENIRSMDSDNDILNQKIDIKTIEKDSTIVGDNYIENVDTDSNSKLNTNDINVELDTGSSLELEEIKNIYDELVSLYDYIENKTTNTDLELIPSLDRDSDKIKTLIKGITDNINNLDKVLMSGSISDELLSIVNDIGSLTSELETVNVSISDIENIVADVDNNNNNIIEPIDVTRNDNNSDDVTITDEILGSETIDSLNNYNTRIEDNNDYNIDDLYEMMSKNNDMISRFIDNVTMEKTQSIDTTMETDKEINIEDNTNKYIGSISNKEDLGIDVSKAMLGMMAESNAINKNIYAIMVADKFDDKNNFNL